VWDGYDPALRKSLISRTNEQKFPYVSFVNVQTWDAMSCLAWHNRHSIGVISNQEIDLGAVDLTMTNAPFCSVLDEICRQNRMHWGFKKNILTTYPDPFLEAVPGWSQTVRTGKNGFSAAATRAGARGRSSEKDGGEPNSEARMRAVKFSWSSRGILPALDILDAVRDRAAEAIKRGGDDAGLAVVAKSLPAESPGAEGFSVTLSDVSVYDAFLTLGKIFGLHVIFDRDAFIFFDDSYAQGLLLLETPVHE
jgi:hypothetical protein